MKRLHKSVETGNKKPKGLMSGPVSWLISGSLALVCAGAAHAFVPTTDPVTQANTARAATGMTSVAAQTTQVVQATRETADAIGQGGVVPSPLRGPLGPSLGSGSEFYTNMENFAYDMCAVTLCVNGDPTNTTDIEEARTWAMESFFSNRVLDTSTQRDLEEIRRRGAAYSTTNALALSVTVHNELAGAGGTANALEATIEGAQNLRGDVQANSVVLLAHYKVALQELAVMTSILEVMAASELRQAGLYHEQGGSNFADALNDADFSDPGYSVRTKVTPPSRGGGGGLFR